ncbi:Uncharacterized protein Adt_08733 [Abeliophyllum distichum]|uniref:Uncharacterized protein n=1 Tax=Abeliophyllum distichum TaxID=126358 RepID=A0ABD1UF80_9LAMI
MSVTNKPVWIGTVSRLEFGCQSISHKPPINLQTWLLLVILLNSSLDCRSQFPKRRRKDAMCSSCVLLWTLQRTISLTQFTSRFGLPVTVSKKKKKGGNGLAMCSTVDFAENNQPNTIH